MPTFSVFETSFQNLYVWFVQEIQMKINEYNARYFFISFEVITHFNTNSNRIAEQIYVLLFACFSKAS